RERSARSAAGSGCACRGARAVALRPRARLAARQPGPRGCRAAARDAGAVRAPAARDRRRGRGAVRIVFVTQQGDPGHPALAATVPKIRALAERVDEVVVLADRTLPGVVPANCRARSFAAHSRAGRGIRFQAALAAELARRPKPAAVVAHMCPIYAVLA